jgi:phage shock protein C
MDTPTNERRLHRSRGNRMLFGVCAGIAEYFAVDPVLIRLVFVAVTLAGGAGVLAYIILAIVMPEEGAAPLPGQAGLRRNIDSLRANTSELTGGAARGQRTGELGALLLVGLGLLLLLSNLGWFDWFRWAFFWPVLLIVLGLALLFRRTED